MIEGEMCIPSLIGANVLQIPGKTAITAPGRRPLSYGRLMTQIGDMTIRLKELGLGRNDRIAVVLGNSPEMAVALLAVASAANCGPLNPGYRKNEFEFYLSDLNVRSLVVASEMNSPAITAAQGLGIPVITLLPTVDAEAGIFTLAGDRYPRQVDGRMAQHEDVALVLHKSGTTSRPKIVPLTYSNLCTLAHNIRIALHLTGGGSLSQRDAPVSLPWT